MPLDYPPIIKDLDFIDGRGFSSGRQERKGRFRRGVMNCPQQAVEDDVVPEDELCAVESITLTAGTRTSVSYRGNAGHEPIASLDPTRPNFAPKIETLRIDWVVRNPHKATAGRLEIYRRKQSLPLYAKELSVQELAAGHAQYDGQTEWISLFPSGFLNVEHGPFKVCIVAEGAVKPDWDRAYTYFDVLLHSITITWGAHTELTAQRDDIHVDHRDKVLVGDRANHVKGLEEEVFDRLVAANPNPAAGQQHKVLLACDSFAKKPLGGYEIEEFYQPTDFERYERLWGDGARIPLHATVKVRKASRSGTYRCTEALAGCRLIWNWHDPDLRKWRVDLTPTAKTEDFLRDIFSQNELAQPPNVANCPAALGGKLGNPDAPIFLHGEPTRAFPYKTEPGRDRTWSTLSHFRRSGTRVERSTSGVIFHPSRIAGDRYPVSCSLYFDPIQDAVDDDQANAPAIAQAGTFEVLKRTNLYYLVRGTNAELGCNPATIEATLKDRYLKEAKTVVEVHRSPVDNATYIRALRQGAAAVERKPNAFTQYQMAAFYARYAIDFNPPANSPGVVLRPVAAFVADVDAAVRAGRLRTVTANGMLPGEELTGATSGTIGIPLTNSTVRDRPEQVLVSPGTEFTDGENVTGAASGTVAPAAVKVVCNCWGHSYVEVTSALDRYDTRVKLSVGAIETEVTYKKTGLKRTLRTDFGNTALSDITIWLGLVAATHDESLPLVITITHKGKVTGNHPERMTNLKATIDELLGTGTGMLDREAFWTKFKAERFTPGCDMLTYRQMMQKAFPITLVLPSVVEAYVALAHPNDPGIFLLHVPGESNSAALPELSVNYKELQVSAAYFGDAIHDRRDQAVTYLSTLPAGRPNMYVAEYKALDSITVHEVGHAIYLPHAPEVDPKYSDAERVKEGCHIKGDTCLMNYDPRSEHFCGMCMLRLRGWNWTPLPNLLGEQEYQVVFELDDVDRIFSAPATSDRGIAERLQVLGLINRPLDHPEAAAACAFGRIHFETVVPAAAGLGLAPFAALLNAEVRSFLIDGGRLPAVGSFAKIRAPGGYYGGFSQNYLMAAIPPKDEGQPAAAPYEKFALGANRGENEDDFHAANPALGKLPLRATVRRRPKGSNDLWGGCPMASDARVYFELVTPDPVSGAPAGAPVSYRWLAASATTRGSSRRPCVPCPTPTCSPR